MSGFLEGRGRTIELAGRKPLALDDPSRVWFVHSGSVELYLVRHDSSGSAGRRFIVEVEAGRIIDGLPAAAQAVGATVLALGLDASLVELDRAALADLAREAQGAQGLADSIDGWIEALADSPAVDRSRGQGRGTVLVPAADTALAPASFAHPESGVLWVCPDTPGCRSLGRPSLAVDVGEPAPVSRGLWFATGSVAVRAAVQPTRALVEEGKASEALAVFCGKLLRTIDADAGRTSSGERERLEAKSQRDAQILQRSFGTLSRVIEAEQLDDGFADAGASAALLAACRLVAHELGLEIRIPPSVPPGKRSKDPLAAIGYASRIRMRKVALTTPWWRRDSGPLLAFMKDDGRPVALIQEGESRYALHDPTRGETFRVTDEVADGLKPTATMFFPSFGDGRLGLASMWKLGLRGIVGELRLVWIVSILAGLLGLATPIVSQILFDDVIPQSARDQLPVIGAVLVVIALATATLVLVRNLALLRMRAKMEIHMEAALMDRLLRLPAWFFREYLAGDLARRVMGITAIRNALRGTALTAVFSGVLSIVSLGLVLYYDVRLALLGLALTVIVVSFIVVCSLFALRYRRRLAEGQGEISGLVLQLMTGIAKLRVAGAERRAFGLWADRFAEQKRTAYQEGNVRVWLGTFNAAYPVLSSILFFGAVYYLVGSGPNPATGAVISTGAFVAVMVAFGQFLGAMLGLGDAVVSTIEIVPQYERLKPILESPLEVSAGNIDPGILRGRIEFGHVSFRYTPEGPITLSDISLEVRAGEMVALVGPSGSGKSTLLRLLLGLERIEHGSIHLDGQDLTSLDIGAVRRQMGVVLQGGRVSRGDVLTNIVGQASDLTIEDAWEAARMVGLEPDIAAMPMRMHTPVGDDGTTFSGGQRQRLMIARAIVHRPPILILDEATSALDNETQRVVSESLDRLRMTRVVIAHRLSTIRHADCIHVLEAGRVVESGRFEALMQQKGRFADLASRQLL